MTKLFTIVLALLAAAQSANAAFGEDLKGELLAALGALSRSENIEAASRLSQVLSDERYVAGDWQALFQDYFESGSFAPSHGSFWDYTIGSSSGVLQQHVALISGLFASEAIGASLNAGASGDPAAFETLSAGFGWLGHIGPNLSANARGTVFAGLAKATGEKSLSAVSSTPERYPTYVQFGLTLRDFAAGSVQARPTVSNIMGFRDAARLFWEARGILLFDNGALDAGQLSSLDLLITLIPGELHNIGAFIVPPSTGIGPGARFMSPAQIVYLEPHPIGVTTNPEEFPGRMGVQPVSSLFTISTASSIVRAIQDVQFARRPELRLRRDVILANARDQRERYLRRYQIVPIGAYQTDPDGLLPSVAYPYFIDSSKAYIMAMYLFELEKQEAMDSFLLLADMLSGGGSTTILFATDPLGRIAHSRTAISRIHLSQIRGAEPHDGGFPGPWMPVNMTVCNGIIINGFTYSFDPDPQGISIRAFRR
ncbi:MAG: hypothetical protein IT364_05820 [Candidatus Hydrogenedentes bacterium]|nr:hypothetical protein [Candidatus Hydrogenedentota bacterium]